MATGNTANAVAGLEALSALDCESKIMKRAASFLVAAVVAMGYQPAAADDGHGALLSGYTMTS
jgi:hypothetical protein